MFLLALLLERVDEPERAIALLRQAGVSEPILLRGRSASAALSTEVPVFAGLRSLAAGADDDRLIAFGLAPLASTEEAQKALARLKLELDADHPPSGRAFGLPLIAGLQP